MSAALGWTISEKYDILFAMAKKKNKKTNSNKQLVKSYYAGDQTGRGDVGKADTCGEVQKAGAGLQRGFWDPPLLCGYGETKRD